MEYLLESFRADWESLLSYAPRLLYATVLLAVFALGGIYAGRLARAILARSPRFRTNQRFLIGLVTWGVVSVGLLIALGVLGFAGVAASMLATGGVVAIHSGYHE